MRILPDWCTPLYDAPTMRAIDRWAIDRQGVPADDLMERAGLHVAQAVEQLMPDGAVAVLCGKGNNGGDGLIAARRLREAGRTVTVLRPSDEGSPSVQTLGQAAVLVDALLGTGFQGEPRGAIADAIAAIDAAGRPVISVDVPSGVDASSGAVAGAAVHAEVTVTFHAAKLGLWINPGKAHAGQVQVVDIGIPRGAPAETQAGLIEPAIVAELPRRDAASTKFSSGHVLVAGGSRNLSGAPRMAALASARAGAGYVTICLPASLQALVAGDLREIMTWPLPEQGDARGGGKEGGDVGGKEGGEGGGKEGGGVGGEGGGALRADAARQVLDLLDRGGALALGPGLGRSSGAGEFARALAARAAVPTVIDADGLNAHAGALATLAQRPAPTVLTPHAGELARLLQCDSHDIDRARLHSVRTAAAQAQAVVVLKGDDTLIADADGHVAVSRGDSPALATAGTGDVLTGVIAALLAQGRDAFAAACAGVWLHAQAGRLAAAVQGAAEGVIAGDVIAALPRARRADVWR
jgi:hydroxyethylthiazole kinase-like uncharacterized protein yjeF